jgi:hypothetical protein
VLFGLAAYGLWRLVRQHGTRSIAVVTLFVFLAWSFLKMGLVRPDAAHAPTAFMGVGVFLSTLPWRPNRTAFGVSGMVVALIATLAPVLALESPPGGSPAGLERMPSRLATMVQDAPMGAVNVGRVARATVQGSYQEELLAEARRDMRRVFRIDPDVVDALRDAEVHASPLDIAAVWAYGLDWRPAYTLQQYSSYTERLDDHSADLVRSREGPDAVLHTPQAVDARVPEWQSPRLVLELSCRYDQVAARGKWSALRRSRDRCGSPELLREVTAAPGDEIPVPRPIGADSIVVATFDVPVSAQERIASALLKPIEAPTVVVDGSYHRFDDATDGQPHLVRVPSEFDGRSIPSCGLDMETMSFPTAGGDVTARFYEIPLR